MTEFQRLRLGDCWVDGCLRDAYAKLTERCARHPEREAEYAVVTHYIYSDSWREAIRADQVLNAVCSDCRLELLHWILTPAGQEQEAGGQRD